MHRHRMNMLQYKASIPLEVAGVTLVALRVLERLNLV